MKTIEIKSTRVGMLTSLVNSLIWVVIPIICAFILSTCCRYFKWSENNIYDLITFFMVIGYILFAIIALLSSWNFFDTIVYGPTDIITLYLDDQGKITKISNTRLGFVRTKYYQEVVCNRILGANIYTPTLGSIFNTGTLAISFVSFANADYEEQTWEIEGIQDPEKIKERITEASPAHEGLKIVS